MTMEMPSWILTGTSSNSLTKGWMTSCGSRCWHMQRTTGGNFKKLNAPFENRFLARSRDIRDRMAKDVQAFVYTLLTDVFNATDTADIVLAHILDTRSHDPGAKAQTIETRQEWTREKILKKASYISSEKGPDGDFDD